MASFLDQVTLATNGVFVTRVQQAMVKVAIAVSAEAASGNSGVDQGRLNFAWQALREPQRFAQLMAFGVVTNASITEESTDGDIEFTVSSMWNAYSGVNPNVTPSGVGGGGFSESDVRTAASGGDELPPWEDVPAKESMGEKIRRLLSGSSG